MIPWLNASIGQYVNEHFGLLVSFQTVCILLYFLETVVTSIVFSQFIDHGSFSPTAIRNVVILFTAKAVLSTLKSYLELRLFPAMFSWFRNHLFSMYLHIQEVRFDDRTVSADMRNLNEAIQLVQPVWFWVMTEIIPACLMMLFLIVYFSVKHPPVGLIQLTSSALAVFFGRQTLNKMDASFAERFAAYNEVLNDLDEKAQNVMNVVLFNQVQSSLDDHVRKEETWLPKYQAECKEVEWMTKKVMWCINISTGLSLGWMYKHSTRKDFVQSLLIFSFYTQTTERVLDYVPEMMRNLSRLKLLARALSDKIFHLDKVVRPFSNQDARIHAGRIDFRNVSFAYEEKEKDEVTTLPLVLSRLRWTVPAGSRVALLAPSGSGKTTLIKLLLDLYTPNAGEILVDGFPVHSIETSHLRDSIHYVNQRTLLFHDTVLNNVMYGVPSSVTRDEVTQLMDRYGLRGILGDLDKMVDYGGNNLSLGMQKVIFLLRGMLRTNARILVLDEPLSSLDPQTRRSVVQMIRDQIGSRTLIVITHDDVGDLVQSSVPLQSLQS